MHSSGDPLFTSPAKSSTAAGVAARYEPNLIFFEGEELPKTGGCKVARGEREVVKFFEMRETYRAHRVCYYRRRCKSAPTQRFARVVKSK